MLRGLFFIVIVVFDVCSTEKSPSVVTESGKIIGHYLTSFGGKRYEAYQGIPYALPPIGERRFEPPKPIPRWSHELVAKNLRAGCWQVERIPFSSGSLLQGDEDCLYLNVYVPKVMKVTRTTRLPVLVYIYGGGFQYGSNKPDEEFFLMDYPAILVTFNYRVGIIGFLSTEDEVVPGNMGLKDQSMALKWIHKNINYFGGDSKRITLYGLSAGGASVHYHYLSPMSAGLFQNGISFSGTSFVPWAQMTNARVKALKVGELMNCTMTNMKLMIGCLKKCLPGDLMMTAMNFMPWRLEPPAPFGPVVEKSSVNAFIDRTPSEIIDSGDVYDVPWITGVVAEEGLFPIAEYTDKKALKDINDNWDTIAPLLFIYNDTIHENNHTKLARSIRRHYFGDKPIDKRTFMDLVYAAGDRYFVVAAENAARAHAKVTRSPVFFYRYTYRAIDSMSFKRSNSTEYFGVCHGDDIYLFMKTSIMSPVKSSTDMAMLRNMISILISFATNGTLNVDYEWSKIDPKKDYLDYLEISGPGCMKMKTIDNLGQNKFWNSIDFNEILENKLMNY